MADRECCPLCGHGQTTAIYDCQQVPVFQNKVYPTPSAACNALVSDVNLTACHACHFVFNASFNIAHMHYDEHYQNEQAHSGFFQDYLSSIVDLFTRSAFNNKKIIEIGCGKGYFLELLVEQGFNVTGFDPAYTGSNTRVIKDYFNKHYSALAAEVIVLRHVLEHIEQPLDFLHDIASAVNYDATIYIEVPSLEWIIQHNAFWDIFYEHCNYFSLASLGSLFGHSEQGLLFNGQYMYVIADLKTLKPKAKRDATLPSLDLGKLTATLTQYRKMAKAKPGMLVWGAGAKGVTFANLVDPDATLIACLVDINPAKQEQYVAKTAHKIISPRELSAYAGRDIVVMNDNYFDEIKASVNAKEYNFIKLSDLEQ